MERKSYCLSFSVSAVAFILLIIPHFKPAYFNKFAQLDFVFNALRIISAFATIILFGIKKCRITPIFLSLLLLQLCLLFSTVINEKSIYPFISSNLLQITLFMLINIYIDSWKRVLRFLLLLAEILTYSNLVSIILVPNGLYISTLLGFYHNWILGYKNQFLPYFFCFMVIAVLYNKYEKCSFRPHVLICAMMISLILAKSSTSVFVFAIFLIMVLFMNNKWVNFANPILLILFNILSFFLVVFFRGMRVFNSFITAIFKRDITLTGRVYIWDGVIRAVLKHPILGLGVVSNAESLGLIGSGGSTAHNTIFQYLFEGGIIAAALFIICNILFVVKLYKCKMSYTAKVLIIGLFTYNLACLVEYYANPLIFVFYALIDNVDRMIIYENQQENRKTRRFRITYKGNRILAHRKN